MSAAARRLGVASARAIAVIGALYVGTIALWLGRERTPAEPIGDPYLAVMEVLTILSAAALVGFVVAARAVAVPGRERAARGMPVAGILAAVVTTAVHAINLAVVRPLWRAGRLPDYRLVWPSALFAIEYVAWDLLVGLTMVLASVALAGRPEGVAACRAFRLGGIACLAGFAGPLSGAMRLQNVAVAGYALVLPVAALLAVRRFRAES